MSAPSLIDRGLTWWLRRGWRGFNTLHRLGRGLNGSTHVRIRTRYGAIFALSPFAYIDRIVLREGYYESEVLEAVRPYFKPDAVFWDIGGNFGLHAITAKFLHPSLQVWAFEPNPKMRVEIASNARLSGVAVQVMPIALTESSGARTFHVNAQGNPGMSTLHAWGETRYDYQIAVQCERADDLVRLGQVPAPTVIKLDVEGGEAAVLMGLGNLLRRPELEALVFEAGRGLEKPESVDPIALLLRQAGFGLNPLRRQEDSEHTLENYLATRIVERL